MLAPASLIAGRVLCRLRIRKLFHTEQLSYVAFRKMSSIGRPKVYITREIPQEGVEVLKEHCDLTHWDSNCHAVPRDELIKNIAGVDGLFCLLTDKIDDAVLDAAGVCICDFRKTIRPCIQ